LDFFQQQDLARRNTRTMVLLYALAVLAVALSVDVLIGIAWAWGMSESGALGAKVPRAVYVGGALATLAKSELMSALFAAVMADGRVRIAEAELMRLAGAVLGCPLPPLIEETEPAP
jgi:hypothetical protein